MSLAAGTKKVTEVIVPTARAIEKIWAARLPIRVSAPYPRDTVRFLDQEERDICWSR